MNKLFGKLVGNGTVSSNESIEAKLEDYIIPGEEILKVFTFIRDSIVVSNKGLYMIDVQGITGRKTEVKFIAGKHIKSISFETAGTMDLDVDIKIFADGHYIKTQTGAYATAPIEFKVPKVQTEEAKEIVRLVKQHHML